MAVLATGSVLATMPGLRATIGLGAGGAPGAAASGATGGVGSVAGSPTPAGSVGEASPRPTTSPGTPGAASGSNLYLPMPINRPGMRESLQAALDQGRLALAAPGMVASVLFPDGSQWTGVSGLADIATRRPLTVATPFPLASMSKTFLAAEILSLVAEARLTLDERAAPLLPGVLVGGQALDPRITVRELLDHTSGLNDYLVDPRLNALLWANPTVVWTPARALRYAGPPLAAPGVGYHYSNTNYMLLGLIAERLTGRTLAEEYRRRFFQPLGLTTASYQGEEPPTSQMPTAYEFFSLSRTAKPVDRTDGTDIRPFTSVTTAAGPAGSVAAGAADVARWVRALYTGQVIPQAQLAAMLDDASATARLKPGFPYGLGVQELRIDGRMSYGHSGRFVGARGVVRWFPDAGVAIAVLTNDSRFDPTLVLRRLLAIAAPVAALPTLRAE